MSFILGLTGSIGMGKSTTAKLFAQMGCAVWDADAAVHRLYAKGGKAVAPMQKVFPDAIVDSAVDRSVLRTVISGDTSALKKIEAVVHPLVAQDRADFIAQTEADIIVLDIPLLFETGMHKKVDAVACVSVPTDIQSQRVMERGTLTESQFRNILSSQMDNDTKSAQSDFVIQTDTLDHATEQVRNVLHQIREKYLNA
ncbi:MAG: dephospho-CoA kinase [Roseobacter sp.]